MDSRRRRLLIRVGLPGGGLVVAAAVVTLVLMLSHSPSQAPAADGQLVLHRATDPGEAPIVAAAFAVITALPQAVTKGDLSSLVEGGPLATAGRTALARSTGDVSASIPTSSPRSDRTATRRCDHSTVDGTCRHR